MCQPGSRVRQWKVCQFMEDFLKIENPTQQMTDEFIVRIVYVLSKMKDVPPFVDGRPKSSNTPPISTTSSPQKESVKLDQNNEIQQLPVIIFDEAHVFGGQTISFLKSSLDRSYLDRNDCPIGIFLSTCSAIDMLLPIAHSNRDSGLVAELQPVSYLPTSDIYRDHLFHLGRPLWHDQRHFQEWRFERLIAYALSRLLPNDDSSLLPLFMCRFGGLTPVNHDAAVKLVHECLAMYSHLSFTTIGEQRIFTSEIAYISEPILVEASIYACSPGSTVGKLTENVISVVMIKSKPLLLCLFRKMIWES